jgi:hypothetical protein
MIRVDSPQYIIIILSESITMNPISNSLFYAAAATTAIPGIILQLFFASNVTGSGRYRVFT